MISSPPRFSSGFPIFLEALSTSDIQPLFWSCRSPTVPQVHFGPKIEPHCWPWGSGRVPKARPILISSSPLLLCLLWSSPGSVRSPQRPKVSHDVQGSRPASTLGPRVARIPQSSQGSPELAWFRISNFRLIQKLLEVYPGFREGS